MLVAEIERLDREEQSKKVSDKWLDYMVAVMSKDSNVALALAELKERRAAEKEQARAAEAAAN